MNLNFDNNWRRTLILTNEADRNIDTPIPYIILDTNNLPCSFKKFCEQFSYEYAFDYDISSKVIWPSNDKVSSIVLVDTLNSTFSKIASIITKKPSNVHNLSFGDVED
jgi:hypothetical protein